MSQCYDCECEINDLTSKNRYKKGKVNYCDECYENLIIGKHYDFRVDQYVLCQDYYSTDYRKKRTYLCNWTGRTFHFKKKNKTSIIIPELKLSLG